MLAILLILSIPESLFGQLKSDLQGSITKLEKETPKKPLSVEDFSYRPDLSANGFINAQQSSPGLAFLSSALIPGSNQAANGKWARAGIYLATEAFSIFYYINRTNTAKDQERLYEAYANREWSVLAYAEWLVNYSSEHGLDNNWETLQANIAGKSPDFSNTTNDWGKVNLALLQSIEKRTALVCGSCSSGNFSHTLPAYGSQQYYELISKYYQFEGGWSDFYSQNVANNNPDYNYLYDNNGVFASDFFFTGVDMAARFNDNYRRAGNILNLLVINHVVSALDALFSVKLNNNRLQAQANMFRADAFSVTLHF